MAKRKIVISEYDNIAALMEEERAVEFIIHRGDMILGDVYLATVENILPSIDAAFVNVGGDKMGFLHSSDVPGKGDLKDRLEPKQQLVVQIMKEPTGHKGPRVSTNISLPGRFLVMMPESKGISISRKIMETVERSRLKSIVSLVKQAGVGVIIRTEAANQKESDITEDFETLLERWQNIVSMADTAAPPTLLYRDQDLLYRVIREAVTEDVTELVVDSAFGHQRAQQLLQNWNMDKGVKVTHYQGNQSILVGTGVDKEIKLALQTKVPLPSGGYLYIQPTEALTVVDVNSGKFTSLQSQAETIKLTNLEACKEIARQLRLRNIGGMIVVDFIDMESRANQLTVLQSFENELAPDKAKPQMGQLSDLGLVEMTRHRQGQSLSEIFTRRCTVCSGTGHAPEEFSWVHTGGDGEGRGRHSRNKLPLRQPNRMQQVPKPAASLSQRKDKSRVTLGQLAEASQKREVLSTVTPGNILLNTLASKRQPQVIQEQETLVEHFSDKIRKATGVTLASVAKLSHMPTGINSILTRINPKANDIVTLVHSIEAASHMPMPLHFGQDPEDVDFDEEGMADDDLAGDEDAEEELVSMNGNSADAAVDDRQTDEKPSSDEAQVHPHTPDDFEKQPTEAPSAEVLTEVVLEPATKPRRGRPAKKQEELDSEAEQLASSDMSEPEFFTELPHEFSIAAENTQPFSFNDEQTFEDTSRNGSLASDQMMSDDNDDADNDDDDEQEASESSVGLAPGGVALPKRRKGRPAKRSIKKPPSKR